jgi:anthranilate synthase component 1
MQPITPDIETFSTRLREGFLGALSTEIPGDLLTPVAAYLAMRGASEASFLLESVEGNGQQARHSFLGVDPAAVIESRGGVTTVRRGPAVVSEGPDIFAAIRSVLPRRTPHPEDGLPRLSGGLVGFIGYDEVRSIERVPCTAEDRTGAPDSLLGLFSTVVVFDHLTRRVRIVACADPADGPDGRHQYALLSSRLAMMRGLLLRAAPAVPGGFTGREASCDLSAFPGMVEAALGHIRDGDIFQVVLSRRASVGFDGDPFQAYRALRMINPSPYHFYFQFGETALLGSSPEMLARLTGETLEHVPIAGTRRRGRTGREDADIASGLLADPKERSEHLMLVDLGRNDLSRVCTPGTVSVERLMDVERFSHVMHLVSLVRGTVRPGVDAPEVLRALFPAGTVSGAPKIRAMQIIDELEDVRRGFYSGAAGYIDFSGAMDFCLTIRTMMAFRGELHLQAGAGIVAKSDPAQETEEVRNKLGALFEAIRIAGEFQQ